MKPNETLDAQGSILWDRTKLETFKRIYKIRDKQKDTFFFEGHEIVAAYAKYLIEYLEGLFKPTGKPVSVSKFAADYDAVKAITKKAITKPHAGSEERP